MSFNKVNIIGYGNLATHLIQALKNKDIEIGSIAGRSISKARKLARKFDLVATSIDDVNTENTLQIICVSDDAVASVSALLPDNAQVVHTAGAVGIESLRQEKRGIFYPLQSFTASREPDWRRIPILLESDDEVFGMQLKALASLLSDQVSFLNEEQRKKIHVAAVVVNNFVNHLYGLAEDWMESEDLNPKLLKPLMLETTLKAMEIGANNAQTGPAKRGDLHTINNHLDLIKNNERLSQAYELITQQILKNDHER